MKSMKFTFLRACSVINAVLPLNCVLKAIVSILNHQDHTYDIAVFSVPMIVHIVTGLIGFSASYTPTKSRIVWTLIFSISSVALDIFYGSALVDSYVREIIVKQCSYGEKNSFGLDHLEDFLCEDLKNSRANSILFFCIVYVFILLNNIVVITMCIKAQNEAPINERTFEMNPSSPAAESPIRQWLPEITP